jgi:predicted glycosyltransferase
VRQKRVVLFAHDTQSLGHIRRVARIAEALQGPCASLVVCGMREAAWIVPQTCELLKLPRWDAMRPLDKPWLVIEHSDALRLRQQWLLDSVRTFAPDAVFVDYLPFGRNDELRPLLDAIDAAKYFVLRGIVDQVDSFLRGEAAEAIGRTFDRIFVTADPRIVNVADEYMLDPLTASKVIYVGYVAPPPMNRDAIRLAHGVSLGRPWIVCSAGGGARAEQFLEHCIRVAADLPDTQVDVVFGPRSAVVPMPRSIPNCRIACEERDLPAMHAACDVAVIAGGYNSMIEAASGGTRIVVKPAHTGDNDEQEVHARRFAHHYPVRLIVDPKELAGAIRDSLSAVENEARPTLPLDVCGASAIRTILLRDLERYRQLSL